VERGCRPRARSDCRPLTARPVLRCLPLLAAGLFGCAGKAPPPAPAPVAAPTIAPEVYKPYIPATKPAAPIVEDSPAHPADAQPARSFLYSIELWEIQLPRFSVSTDEAFWKRVNEQALDLPTYDVLFKNGLRVGTMPIGDLGAVSQEIQDRKGTRTVIQGTAGRQMELPVTKDVESEVLFYLNRSNELVGRSYEKCDNFLDFSFETTPRNPDKIRLAFTPMVRSRERKLQYSLTPGKPDREISYTSEEKHYDMGLSTDLPLQYALIIAPSVEAKVTTSIGSRFLLLDTPSEQRERLIVVIPHAYERAADAPSQ